MEKNRYSRMREQILRISGVNADRCIRCGKCSGTCPAYDIMEYHPHQVVRMVGEGDLGPLLTSSAVFRCLSCMACSERCPRGVAPAKLMEAVRQMVVREQNGDHLSPDVIPALLDDEMPQQAIVSALRKYRK